MDLAAVEAHAHRLGASLPSRSVVWLEGPMGAGKTTFARALLAGRGVTEPGASPSYAIVHHHAGPRGDAYHLDCWRLRSPDEAGDLDWESLLAADLLLIEWPERAGAYAPTPTHRVQLVPVDAEHRRVLGG